MLMCLRTSFLFVRAVFCVVTSDGHCLRRETLIVECQTPLMNLLVSRSGWAVQSEQYVKLSSGTIQTRAQRWYVAKLVQDCFRTSL